MSNGLKVIIPPELLALAEGYSAEDFAKKNTLLWIFELYQQGKVSLSRAAELAKLKVDEFLLEFRKRHLLRQGGPSSSKEAESELENALSYVE